MHDDHNVNDDDPFCTSELESMDTVVYLYSNLRRWNAETNTNMRHGEQLSRCEVAESPVQPTRMHDDIYNDDDDDNGTGDVEPVGHVEQLLDQLRTRAAIETARMQKDELGTSKLRRTGPNGSRMQSE